MYSNEAFTTNGKNSENEELGDISWINVKNLKILIYLYRNKYANVSTLQKLTRTNYYTLLLLLKDLENRGYVEEIRVGKSRIYNITEKGKTFIDGLKKLIDLLE